MQPGVFRQIDFSHAAGAQRGDDYVWTKSRAFSDRHIACFRGSSDWVYETVYIVSPFDSGHYASGSCGEVGESRSRNLAAL